MRRASARRIFFVHNALSETAMSQDIAALVRGAHDAARMGRWDEAEAIWQRVHQADPQNPQALYSLGVHAFQRGDLKGAIDLLGEAARVAPGDASIQMSLGVARRESGDLDGEWDAINAALAADAYFLPALLGKGQFLEHTGRPKAAADVYRNVLRVAPPETHWPEPLREQLQHARAAVEAYTNAYSDFLERTLALPRAALSAAVKERWTEAASIMAGRTQPYLSNTNQLNVPRLPAVPFFDRSLFPWAEKVEAHTDAIRAELVAALEAQKQAFTPYIGYKPGEPVNQWGDLNHSERWSTYALWRGGQPVVDNLQHCPVTRMALAEAELVEIDGLCPNAMFSALAPHTHIPPHHGETNARVVVHLPLIVPDNCIFRVGFERREWKVGELMMFDDTIEHEARNDSDELRVVLIFDAWNPLITLEEREMVKAMALAARTFSQI